MSSCPSGSSVPVRSAIRRRRRCASGTPRWWMPTSATSSSSSFRSMISCAMRESVRSIASASRTTFPADTLAWLKAQAGSGLCGRAASFELLSGLAGPVLKGSVVRSLAGEADEGELREHRRDRVLLDKWIARHEHETLLECLAYEHA